MLDYGLAKAFEGDTPAGIDSELSQAPTLTRQGTQIGVILGTAAYMSPEQALGKRVDKRTDIWAFGAVVYEMLTGKKAFPGDNVSEMLAAVLRAEPEWNALPSDLAPPLRAYLRRCLEKDSKRRMRDIGDVCLALDGAFETTGSAPSDAVAAPQRTWNPLTLAFASLFLLAAGLAGWTLLRPEPPRPLARFESPFREGQAPIGPFELMRDGSGMVYVGQGPSDGSQLWIRNWRDLDARPIPGTEAATKERLATDWASLELGQLTLSPDGREVAFVVGASAYGPLRVVPLAGGPGRTLAEAAKGAAWSQDGWIYSTSGADFNIIRVRSTGGEVEILTELSEGEEGHGFPQPLPDGNALLFQVWRARDGSDAEIWWLDLETAERKLLTLGNNPRYVTSGHLLFGTPDGRLMAAAFDVERAALTGAATRISEGLFNTPVRGNLVYTVSGDGSLVYVAGKIQSEYEFVWVTRSGEATPVGAGEPFKPNSSNRGWRLSPDGNRIAFGREVDGNDDIWIKRLPDGPVSRLTFSDDPDVLPQWAPDGQSVTYRNVGLGQLWSRQADGTGEPELVFDGFNTAKGVWSPDGEWLVLRIASYGDASGRDILAMRAGVDTAAVPLIATGEFAEQAPAISRDGRWLAYSSNETGRHEVFVRPFPNVDAGKWQISTGGGLQPVWAHNGRELFFADPKTRELKAAAFTTTSTRFQRTRITRLFEIEAGRFFYSGSGASDFYDVALNDERFLTAQRYGVDDASMSLVLVQNFSEELKRLVPSGN